jgi:hypothetical protein
MLEKGAGNLVCFIKNREDKCMNIFELKERTPKRIEQLLAV